MDHNVALTMTRTLEDFLSDFSYSQPRFVLLVLGVFAGDRAGAGGDRSL